MLEIKTNLSENDYDLLMFNSYISKKQDKIREEYYKQRKLVNCFKSKLIILKIEDKEYLGEIQAYPLVLEYHPTDYKCKRWELDIKTFFKVYININIDDKEVITKLDNDVLIDNKKYYVGNHEFKDNIINFNFIAYETYEKDNKIIL